MDLLHHFIHFLMYSLLLWQTILGLYILLIWASKNFKFTKSPIFNLPESNVGDSVSEENTLKKNTDMGPIDVKVDKSIFIDTKTDESSVKLDEKIKGKVKTQKDKLRNLRK